MEEILLLVDKMLKESNNIPGELKGFVAAICKAYVRNSNGMISLKGIENVCKTKFVKINENDKAFATENNILGRTDIQVLSDGNLSHIISYVNANNMIKLIMILTHELGHVITECKVNEVFDNGHFPFMKRTGTYYLDSFYEENTLKANSWHGVRLSDEFLEAICESILKDEIFREEIRLAGCDLEDFVYKDSRLFSSRVYDEFRDCFKLFDAILDGKLFEFACMEREDNVDYINFINENRIYLIY